MKYLHCVTKMDPFISSYLFFDKDAYMEISESTFGDFHAVYLCHIVK